jgi:CubicO group peptidase (beta-lactamase class C family)
LKTVRPEISADLDFHPGFKDGFGLGFLINSTAYPGGRSAGTLAWAGLENTYYWIDRRREICAVMMMRFHPFGDPRAMGLLSDFEHAVYASV